MADNSASCEVRLRTRIGGGFSVLVDIVENGSIASEHLGLIAVCYVQRERL
jgi:hypothetical protein